MAAARWLLLGALWAASGEDDHDAHAHHNVRHHESVHVAGGVDYDEDDIEPGPPDEEEEDSEDENIYDEVRLTTEQLRTLHAKIDRDGDGKASFEELKTHAQDFGRATALRDTDGMMQDIDGDKDGYVSLAEYQDEVSKYGLETGGHEHAGGLFVRERFEAADVDGDGRLNKDELPAVVYPELNSRVLDVAVKQALRRGDRDGDNKLSPWELWNPGTEAEPTEDENLDFADLDKNGDGLLDAAELRPYEAGLFHTHRALKDLLDEADTDEDGHLTEAELQAVGDDLDSSHQLHEWATGQDEL